MRKISTSNVSIKNNQTIKEAMQIVNDAAIGACIVLNNDKVFVGILTDGDIRRSLLSGLKLDDKVSKIVNTESFTILEGMEDSIGPIDERIQHIPIISEKGFVKHLLYQEPEKIIPVAKPSLNGNELKYLKECITEGWISSNGKFIKKFEKSFSEYCGTDYALAVSNGTVALHLALVALGIGIGDEVIVPSLSFIATANAVSYTGATPVFVDSEKETWNIDPKKIESSVTAKTKAIIPVHLYGQPAKMKMIMTIANKHNLRVIEDSAEAHGAIFMEKQVGAIGDIGCFSFFGNKIITTGEGGMLVTNNKELYEKANLYRDHGMSKTKKYWHDVIGFNYRMTNLQAAIGCAQMERIDEILDNKYLIANTYREYLEDNSFIIMPTDNNWSVNVFWMFPIIISVPNMDNNKIRNHILKILEISGVESRPFFFPIHNMPPYKLNTKLPISEELSANGLVLPSYVGITKQEINKISQIVIDEVSFMAKL